MSTIVKHKNGKVRQFEGESKILPQPPAGAEAPPAEQTVQTDPPSAHRALPRRAITVIVVAMVAAVLVAYGHDYWRYASTHETTDDAFLDGHTVLVAPKVAGNIQHLYVTDNQLVKKGQLLAEIDPADYEARAEQAQATLNGARYKLESARINVGVTHHTTYGTAQQARAGVSNASSGVAVADAAVSNADANILVASERVAGATAQVQAARDSQTQAQAQVRSAAIEAGRTEKDEARYQELLRSQYVTQQQVDNAVAAHRTAVAQLASARGAAAAASSQIAAALANERAARQALLQAQSQLVQTQAQAQQARAQTGDAAGRLQAAQAAPAQVAASRSAASTASADVAQAEATLRQARLNLGYTKIFAVQDGHVTRRTVEEGTYLQVGQAMFALVSPDVWVTANYKETQLTRMRAGQAAAIRVSAYPQITLRGHVDSIQRGSGAAFSLLPPQNATGNYVKVVQRVPVKIVIDDPRARTLILGPGMSVEPEVALQ